MRHSHIFLCIAFFRIFVSLFGLMVGESGQTDGISCIAWITGRGTGGALEGENEVRKERRETS